MAAVSSTLMASPFWLSSRVFSSKLTTNRVVRGVSRMTSSNFKRWLRTSLCTSLGRYFFTAYKPPAAKPITNISTSKDWPSWLPRLWGSTLNGIGRGAVVADEDGCRSGPTLHAGDTGVMHIHSTSSVQKMYLIMVKRVYVEFR